MGPGTSRTVQLVLTAVGSHPPHTLTDTATVTGAADENADPANDAIDTATVELTRGGVDVEKSLAAGQDPIVQVGQTVTYDITVTNTGDIDLATVPLADEFDSAVFAFTTATVAPERVLRPIRVSWSNVGPLAVGETTTVTSR